MPVAALFDPLIIKFYLICIRGMPCSNPGFLGQRNDSSLSSDTKYADYWLTFKVTGVTWSHDVTKIGFLYAARVVRDVNSLLSLIQSNIDAQISCSAAQHPDIER